MNINVALIGWLLFLMVMLYFLFRLGARLYNRDLYDMTIWAWILAIFLLFWGFGETNKNNLFGLMGFIPIVTYISLHIFENIPTSYSAKQKIKTIFFSAIFSALAYIVTHSLFGFGIPEATLSGFIAAAILGWSGYNA